MHEYATNCCSKLLGTQYKFGQIVSDPTKNLQLFQCLSLDHINKHLHNIASS